MGEDGEAVFLTVRKVAKFYGNKLIFKDVTFDVSAGQVMLIAGQNGVGKSTLVRIMAGLSTPSAGTVDVQLAPENIAYLGHTTCQYPGLTALANLTFWGTMYGLSPSLDQLMAILQRVGLERAAEEKAGSFSRGMAQRLNLARIYLVSPKLIFLDEPGTGLDPQSLERLRREIVGLKESGTSVVWISHHVTDDVVFADKVLALGRKTVSYFGDAESFSVHMPEVRGGAC